MTFPSFSRPILNQGGKLVVTSGWGADRSYRGGTHNGIDAPAPVGLPVRAAAAGRVVTVADWGSNGGKAVVIEHLAGLKTRYLHLDRFAVGVGDNVFSGQLIGYSGTTGSSSAHLHFDIRGSQPWVDEYVRRFGKPSGTTWPGEYTSGGYGIPSEPLIPVDVWATSVANAAKLHGIPLYAGIGVGVLLIGGVAAYLILKGRK